MARLVGAAAIAGLVLAVACGGAGRRGGRPSVTLASTPATAAEIAEIREAWDDLANRSQQELRLRIERFLKKNPDDGAAPLARVYLTLVFMNEGAWAKADQQLALLASLPRGATRDFALVARARGLRHAGRPDEAFELLRPLAGKMVDRHALEQFQEELSLAAAEAHRDFEAIAYMDSWLRFADEDDREIARKKIPEALAHMQPGVLEASLRAMRTGGGNGYTTEMQRLIAGRLAAYAVERGDTRLAQWLVDPDAGTAVLAGDAGLLISELAVRHHDVASVNGRTIGLILPTGTPEMRDVAADVARGVAWALELPRKSAANGDSTRLTTRDDGGRGDQVESVLDDVAGDGAAIIIAGFDPGSADRAVRWSEAHGVPVVVLSVPRQKRAMTSSFVVGEPNDRVISVLADALSARRETKVAIVTDNSNVIDIAHAFAEHATLIPFQPVPCELEGPRVGDVRFPLAAWEKAGYRTWLIAGPAACARDALRELAQTRGGLVALTLDAMGPLEEGTGVRVIAASAGLIPVLAPGKKTSALDPDIQRFMASFGSTPTWRTALGRDAAILARHAVASLPLDTTMDAREVVRRRTIVRAEFTVARDRLWTTEAPGVDASHSLARTVRVVDIPAR
jgi:Periplasmic binding protein